MTFKKASPSHKDAALRGRRDASELVEVLRVVRRFDETVKDIRVDFVGILEPCRLDLVGQVIGHRVVQVVQVAILVLWKRRSQPNLYDFLAKFLGKNLITRKILQDIITNRVINFDL